MASTTITKHKIACGRLRLSVLELGDPTGPCVVMLHGLRDCGAALVPVAEQIVDNSSQANYRILIAELRGHGDSDTSEAYAISNFVTDLHSVMQNLVEQPCALFGHSLGGHIVTRYAAIFPEQVNRVIIVDGTGPPHRPQDDNAALSMQNYRRNFEQHFNRTNNAQSTTERRTKARPIVDLDDVAARLCRNNPRMNPNEATRLAPHMVRQTDSGLVWAFDSHASSVFMDTHRGQDELFWQQIQAPVCAITGARSHEYWSSQMPQPGFTGHFAEGEMEQRLNNFSTHEHHWFEHSGHMVHYDEPDRLAQVCLDFLQRNFPAANLGSTNT